MVLDKKYKNSLDHSGIFPKKQLGKKQKKLRSLISI